MAKNITKRDMFAYISKIVSEAQDISEEDKGFINAFCQKEFTSLTKKKKTLTKAQRENLALMDEIEAYLVSLEEGKASVAEIADHFSITSQKATAMFRALVKAERVVRSEDEHKKVFYSLA